MTQAPFSSHLFDIVAPELGEGCETVQFVMWLVPVGTQVIPGERIAEILTQGILLQLEVDVEGVLVQQLIQPGMSIQPGKILGVIDRGTHDSKDIKFN